MAIVLFHAYAKITIKCGKSSFVHFIMVDEKRENSRWHPVGEKDIPTVCFSKSILLGMVMAGHGHDISNIIISFFFTSLFAKLCYIIRNIIL